MNTLHKIALFALSGLVAIMLVIIILLKEVIFPIPSVKKMARVFERNQSHLLKIVEILPVLGFKTVGIRSFNENYHNLTVYDTIPVQEYPYNNDELFLAIQFLFDKQKCDAILLEKNYVCFKWGGTLDAVCGIVYSLDGEMPTIDDDFPANRREESYIPLEHENWYYFHVKRLHTSSAEDSGVIKYSQNGH